jgi:hypothetical protein
VLPICQKYEQIREMLSSILGHFPDGENFDQFLGAFSKTDVSQ